MHVRVHKPGFCVLRYAQRCFPRELAGRSSGLSARRLHVHSVSWPRNAARGFATWFHDSTISSDVPASDNEPALKDRKKATLVLDDGTEMEGYAFGAQTSMSGEVVFNTGMVGYPESLTDPSYAGQILMMTYPMVGNYGVPPDNLDQWDLVEHFESDRIWPRGLIVSDYSHDYSHWKSTRSLSEWLQEQNVPGIYGIDTRALTQKLREGTVLGKIVIGDGDVEIEDTMSTNLIAEVSRKDIKTYGEGQGDVKLLAVDCGIKTSIIRSLVSKGAVVTVVPWDYDFVSVIDEYDGLFLSNGPGDPTFASIVVERIKKLIDRTENIKPIFGICMGHQLLSLAAGATTHKMQYGHRGHNQPCIDLTDLRCYITSQNHGFCVDTDSLSADWEPYFINANDQTSEGIIHKAKPYYSVQFHPEAKGGPEDTLFLFDRYLNFVRDFIKGKQRSKDESLKLSVGKMLAKGKSLRACMGHFDVAPLSVISPENVRRTAERPPRKVLLLGSGGLQIGQAGEFDYSGSQAIKALKEEGIECILINPNIATVQTAKGLADKVYFLPVTPEFVESIIEKERPDGIFLQFGGQTALNCGVQLYDSGVLSRFGVQVLGTSVETIVATEDRDIFATKLTEIDQPIAKSIACTTVEDAIFAADQIGYPVIARTAFSLGGLGSGFAHNRKELEALVSMALASSPQVLIERSMRGWKELEYEVVRDAFDNCITVCNMENFDPLGTHTGDSIVVAPSQTIDDDEYQMLRTAAIAIVRHLGIVGECNVQYALHPTTRQFCVIEVNPRLSRSSALASKATGYPLAWVAAKIALGQSLPDIKNSMTKVTSACFEPSLDYCVVKIPRWDMRKFSRVNNKLGSGMKSVGEVMAIGRNFEETFQKALRMVDASVQGFEPKEMSDELMDEIICNPTEQRVFALARAMEKGYDVDQLHDMSKIDRWFLYKLRRIHRLKKTLQTTSFQDPEMESLMRVVKQAGFSDLSIGAQMRADPLEVRSWRKARNIVPVMKKIDTLAAEWPAASNYLFSTYNAKVNDVKFEDNGVVVLGGGCYCIGNSVEFDYTAVSCIRTLRELGKKTVMVNYNPETVSTDYDESDRLYFEELSLERVLDICDKESPEGVVVSVGGQIPNNLAIPLHKQNIHILGTHPEKIDNAEDRMRFSDMCDRIGVDQPEWKELTTMDEAYTFADKVGYPVLVRPSYVLSGAAMRVIRTSESLEKFLEEAAEVSKDHPVVISKFILGAKEIEMDGVGNGGDVLVYAIHEHVENAGVHSGDATLVLPPQDLSEQLRNMVRDSGTKICKALEITGPFNAQFIVDERDNSVKVIECNVRASRSFPFVSKILGVDLIQQAVRCMLQHPVDPSVSNLDWSKLDFVGCKVPNFSFARLGGADPVLGVEMASTGEVACYGKDKYEAFLKAMLARNFILPKKNILLMTGEQTNKEEFLPYAKKLIDLGFELFGTPGTARHLRNNAVKVTEVTLEETQEDDSRPWVVALLKKKEIHLTINFVTPMSTSADEAEYLRRYKVRRSSIDFSVPVIYDLQVAKLLVESLEKVTSFELKESVGEYTHCYDGKIC